MDVMVANAGMGNSKGLLEMSLDEYKQLMSVNGMLVAPRPTSRSHFDGT